MSVRGVSIERAMFVVMAVLFGLAVIEGNPVFLFYTVLGVGGAAYLYGATKDRPAARR
jgi:membrane protease YdiL (CAAX protease family)